MSISNLSTQSWQQNTSALCNEFGNICYLFPQHSSDVHQILHSNSPFKSPPSLFQIMVLTDPEFESSVLISSDEGASYQKYRLAFYVLSLLFHPTVEDWALAYSHDQKVSLLLLSHLFSVHVQGQSFSIPGQTFCYSVTFCCTAYPAC